MNNCDSKFVSIYSANLCAFNDVNVLTVVDLDVSEFGKASYSIRQAADGARKTELPVSDQEDTGTLLQVQNEMFPRFSSLK